MGSITPISTIANIKREEYQTYLPTLLSPQTLVTRAAPIWPSGLAATNSNQVALFRATFTLTRTLENAQLEIFADTRYDAWVDGFWVGRGPARFSRTLHEYDVISIGTLFAGMFVIAGLYFGQLTLSLVGMFVFVAGRQERSYVRYQEHQRQIRDWSGPTVTVESGPGTPPIPGFSGLVWEPTRQVWVVWRDGRPVNA